MSDTQTFILHILTLVLAVGLFMAGYDGVAFGLLSGTFLPSPLATLTDKAKTLHGS